MTYAVSATAAWIIVAAYLITVAAVTAVNGIAFVHHDTRAWHLALLGAVAGVGIGLAQLMSVHA